MTQQQKAIPSPELEEIRTHLFTALLSDVMDGLGAMHQALPPRVRPLDDASIMVGRARTALFADVYDVATGENPYENEIRLIDSLRPGDIPVFACGGTGRIAPWGELLSTAAAMRGAAGVLMDGLVRDVRAIRKMAFLFSTVASDLWTAKAAAELFHATSPLNVPAYAFAPATLCSVTPTVS